MKNRKLKLWVVNFFSTKIFTIGISFIIGFSLGYYLGYIGVGYTLMSTLSKFNVDLFWIERFVEISPNSSFLSDIAAFEAAIIAFLIPLSIEIVSKLSERYQSDVIIRTFEDSFENKNLPRFLMINIIAAIVLRFFTNQNAADDLVWKIFAWMILIAFIYIAYAILRVINRIKAYMINTRFVIDQLYEDIEKVLK